MLNNRKNLMKKLKSIIAAKLLVLFGVMFLTFAMPNESFGQVKIKSITEMDGQIKSASTALKDWSKYIIGAVLLIALIGVIYMVATSHPKSKEAVIGWIVAIVIYTIAVAVV